MKLEKMGAVMGAVMGVHGCVNVIYFYMGLSENVGYIPNEIAI